MFFIISHLDFPTASCFINGFLHRLGHGVRIHDDVTLTITGSTTDGLDKPTFITEEAFLIRIENSNQTDFRYVNPFTKEVDTDQDIKNAQTQITDDFCPLQGLNVRVHVFDLDPHFLEVIGQVFRHLLGQGGNKRPLSPFYTHIDFTQEIVHLTHGRTHFHLRIE